MSNNLNIIIGNPREVLFEKSQIYYFKTKSGFKGSKCLEMCMVHNNGVAIGSHSCCTECIYNKGYSDNELFVICTKIKQATKEG